MDQQIYRRVVPATFVQFLYEYLDMKGYAPELVLGEPWPEPQGIGGIDVERWNRMLQKAADKLEDSLLGLHLGKRLLPGTWGSWGQYCLPAKIWAQCLSA